MHVWSGGSGHDLTEKTYHIPELFNTLFGDNALKIHVSENKFVRSCNACEGIGFKEHEELYDYHRRDYHTVYNDCRKCKGDGRLTVTETSIRFSMRHPQTDLTKVIENEVPFSADPLTQTSQHSWSERANIDLTNMKVY